MLGCGFETSFHILQAQQDEWSAGWLIRSVAPLREESVAQFTSRRCGLCRAGTEAALYGGLAANLKNVTHIHTCLGSSNSDRYCARGLKCKHRQSLDLGFTPGSDPLILTTVTSRERCLVIGVYEPCCVFCPREFVFLFLSFKS